MRRGVSASAMYVVACVLIAAVIGRLVDQSAGLPGVHESSAVRGGGAAWVVCLLTAFVLGVIGAARWSSTRRIRSTAQVVVPGQLGVFLAGEVAVRLAAGRGPFDPDALVGGALQGLLALLLLLALAVVGIVLLRCRSLPTCVAPVATRLRSSGGIPLLLGAESRQAWARGPPRSVRL